MSNQSGLSPALKIVLVFVLVVFLIVVGGLAWAVYKLWPLLKTNEAALPTVKPETVLDGADSVNQDTTDKNPLLNADQERVLENLGVDVAALPQAITPALEQCFIEKLGPDRVKEIKVGYSLTVMDFFQANSCF
ncbi:MAG TPA: hypothetical protein PK412_00585 [bacterium]|nr:hypothetical protein [bacterium]